VNKTDLHGLLQGRQGGRQPVAPWIMVLGHRSPQHPDNLSSRFWMHRQEVDDVGQSWQFSSR
jgi:hypothetical protein